MKPPRPLANLFALALLAGLAIALAAQREARIQAETEHVALERQVQTLRALAAENAQLSNLLARASAPAPPGEASAELLRLRGEVGLLRRQTAGLETVLAENRQARLDADRDSAARASDAAKPAPTADYWPRDSWAFAGYATPDATLKTLLWAANNGDLKTLLAGVTGKFHDALGAIGQSNDSASAELIDQVSKVQSFRVLDRSDQPDGTVLITATLEKQYDPQTMKLVLQKVGADWKVADGQ